MKKIIGMLAVYASLVLLAVPVFAQTPAAPAAPQGACTAENKLAWYTEFRQIFKTDQAKGYELAQKYLACPAEAGEEPAINYLKGYVALIEKARRTPKVAELVYDKKDYAKAFELGKQVLAEEPENIKVLIDLSYAGYLAAASKVDTYNSDSMNYSKKAIQLIQSGTAPQSWVPYIGKDEALAYLNNTIGVLTIGKNPSEALPFLLKTAQLEGKLKKQPITYGNIGDAYQSGPYDRLSADYKAKFEGKDETPESKLALENINQVIDRMIDAYARAVALSGSDPANQAIKKAWLDTLTTWYKFRHNQSDAGINELIAGVMAKPLPPEPTPLTTVPASTPTTTTTPTSGNTNAAGAATGSAVSAPTNKTPTTTTPASSTSMTAPKTTTTPTSSTTPAKPKPKNNHKRGH